MSSYRVASIARGTPLVSGETLRRLHRSTTEAATAEPVEQEAVTDDDRAQLKRLQTALGLAQAKIEALGNGPALATPEDPLVCQLQAFLAERGRQKYGPQLDEVMYDDHDFARWGLSFFSWWRRLVKTSFREPNENTPLTIPMPEDARIAFFADWGSGRYGAPEITKTIAALPSRLDAVIHLGDVYYAGTENEFSENVIPFWPRRLDARSYVLNGNHEVYGGDHAYYAFASSFGQTTSYFALQNSSWTVVCLDSAYEDHQLAGHQVDWFARVIAQAGNRQVILMSHHQPFSAFEGQGPKLVAALRSYLDAGRINAWYFGHEHRLAIYDRHPKWSVAARCVGHGGYPYFRVTPEDGWTAVTKDLHRFPATDDAPGGLIATGNNPYVTEDPDRYGAQGFVTLRFDGPNATESYFLPEGGSPIWTGPLA